MQDTTRIQVQEDDSPTLGPQFQEWKLNLCNYPPNLILQANFMNSSLSSYSPSLNRFWSQE